MMARPLIDPRMLGRLNTFYPSVCTIQISASLASSFGAKVDDWQDLDGYDAIPCSVAPLGMGSPTDEIARRAEVPYAEMTTFDDDLFHIALKGYFPLIAPGMRALLDDGATYDVRAVEHDSHQATSRLRVVKVTP